MLKRKQPVKLEKNQPTLFKFLRTEPGPSVSTLQTTFVSATEDVKTVTISSVPALVHVLEPEVKTQIEAKILLLENEAAQIEKSRKIAEAAEKLQKLIATLKPHQLACMTKRKCILCFFTGATFGFEFTRKRLYCNGCHPSGTHNVVHKLCECGLVRPSFALPGEKAKFCANCKISGCLNVRSKKCVVCQLHHATFGLADQISVTHCATCKTADMVALNQMCITCKVQYASFTNGVSTKAFYCRNCKLDISKTTNKLCECGKRPSLGIPGSTKRQWCSTCPSRPSNAVLIDKRLCVVCKKVASGFAEKRGQPGTHCKNCKPAGYVLTRAKICITCNKRYACSGTKNQYCVTCTDKDCTRCPCGTRPRFNFIGLKPICCASCRTTGMLENPRARCREPGCQEIALFGIGTMRNHCEMHKLTEERDLIQKPCISCGLIEMLDANKRCKVCDPAAFAAFKVRKEIQIKNMLDACGFKYTTHNKIMTSSQCGKERPDFVFDFGTHFVIVEVDENQHITYQCLCEQVRMMNLVHAAGGVPCFFIRYNPDKFKMENATAGNVADSKRHAELRRMLKWSFVFENVGNKSQVVYLFFDGCKTQTYQSDIFTLLDHGSNK